MNCAPSELTSIILYRILKLMRLAVYLDYKSVKCILVYGITKPTFMELKTEQGFGYGIFVC